MPPSPCTPRSIISAVFIRAYELPPRWRRANHIWSIAERSRTDIPEGSVDAVITDPPFFDNVHYSQLADFFYVWQRHFLGHNGKHALLTTRQSSEVQHSDCEDFTTRLCSRFGRKPIAC